MTKLTRGVNIFLENGPIKASIIIANVLYDKLTRSLAPKFWYWKFLGPKPLECAGETIYVNISDYFGDYRESMFIEANELGQIEDILAEINADDVFLDIGANIGVYSIFVDRYASKTIGVEPHPTNCSHFMHNCEINSSNVNIVSCALSNSAGFTGLSGPRGGLRADGSVTFSELTNTEGQVLVRSEIGDEFIEANDFPSPTIIKIDVEGAEGRVIDGLENILSAPECRLVYCEIHEDMSEKQGFKVTEQTNAQLIWKKLRVAGFEIETIESRDYGTTIKASK